jgi:hypothetical protein
MPYTSACAFGDQARGPDLVGPVVVVGDAAQRRLDSASDHRHAGERLATPLCVDRGRAIGPQARAPARRVGVRVAALAVRGVVVDQRAMSGAHARRGAAGRRATRQQTSSRAARDRDAVAFARASGRGSPPRTTGDRCSIAGDQHHVRLLQPRAHFFCARAGRRRPWVGAGGASGPRSIASGP